MKATTLIALLAVAALLITGIVFLIQGLFPPGTPPDVTDGTTEPSTETTTQSTTQPTTQPTSEPTQATTEPEIDDSTIPIVIVPGNRPTEPTEVTEPSQEATEPSQEGTEPSQEETEPTQKETSGNDWNINFGDLIGKK